MADFKPFFRVAGSPSDVELATEKLVSRYRRRVPKELVEFWREHGFGSYRDGLLWVVNPNQLDSVLRDWALSSAVPIVRSAFGDVIYWHKARFELLNPNLGARFDAGPDTGVLFTFYLIDGDTLKSIFHEALFKRARRELGPLTREEMYGFKLPIAMGGGARGEEPGQDEDARAARDSRAGPRRRVAGERRRAPGQVTR